MLICPDFKPRTLSKSFIMCASNIQYLLVEDDGFLQESMLPWFKNFPLKECTTSEPPTIGMEYMSFNE